jgi:biotin operon repressor
MNEQLNTFIQVAESGSLSKAAEKLFVSSTAVMKQINLLEKHVGVPLLIRTNHDKELSMLFAWEPLCLIHARFCWICGIQSATNIRSSE